MILGMNLQSIQPKVVLLIRAEGPQRFSEIAGAMQANPNTVDRALKAMIKNRFIVAETLPGQGRTTRVQYRITKRGRAAAEVLDALVGSIRQHERELGRDAVRAAEAAYASAD